MKIRSTSALVLLGSVFLASCYPIDGYKGPNWLSKRDKKPAEKKMPEKTMTEAEKAEQLKEQERRKREKATAERRRKAAENAPDLPDVSPDPGSVDPGASPDATTPTPPAREKTSYPTATKVPGQDGYVLSPFNNKKIDVRDMASGTLVQDPTYTGNGKGYFRVP